MEEKRRKEAERVELERKIEEVSNNLDDTSKSENKKVPRNAKCPCGSGKKFKHCCGKVTN